MRGKDSVAAFSLSPPPHPFFLTHPHTNAEVGMKLSKGVKAKKLKNTHPGAGMSE
jgi:hypothetical protein